MSKRSSGQFVRRDRDAYPTPAAAVRPLIPWLAGICTFAQPCCCGDGALVRHLESHGLHCAYWGDIATGQNALAVGNYGDIDAIITNPPWARPALHPLIQHFPAIAPTWLLFDSDWAHTKQAIPYLGACTDILPIGRLIWIPGTTMHGKDNAAWYRFDRHHTAGPVFHPYRSPPAPHVQPDNRFRYQGPRGTSRRYVLARLAREARADLAAQVETGAMSVRAALRQIRGGNTS